MKRKLIVSAVLASVSAGSILGASAADVSTERTTMPSYCSERDVTCVLPDPAGAARAVPAPRGTAGNGGSISGTTPATTPSSPGSTGTSTSTESKVVVTPPVSSTSGTAGIQTRGAGSTATGNTTSSGRTTIGTTSGATTGSGAGATGGSSGGGAAGTGGGGLGGRR